MINNNDINNMDQKCPVCSYENPEDALYCSLCKYVFRKEKQKEFYRPSPSVSSVASKSPTSLKIITILIMVAIGFVIWKAYHPHKEEGYNPAAKYPDIIDVDDTNFDSEVLNSELPVVVYFYSSSCKPCWQRMPKLVNLAKKNKGILKVAKVKAAPIIFNRYRLLGLPTTIIFNKGREVVRNLNGTPEDLYIDPTFVEEIERLSGLQLSKKEIP